jgi:hypothetical protein
MDCNKMVKSQALSWNPELLVFDYWPRFTHMSTDSQGEVSNAKKSVNYQNNLHALKIMLPAHNRRLLIMAT